MKMTVDTQTRQDGRIDDRDDSGSRHSKRTALEWALVIIIAAGLLAAYLSAVRDSPEAVSLGTRPILVQSGDSLWSLAKDNPVPGLTTAQTVEYITAINDLSPAVLAAGSVIEIPHGHDGSTAEVASR